QGEGCCGVNLFGFHSVHSKVVCGEKPPCGGRRHHGKSGAVGQGGLRFLAQFLHCLKRGARI
ncbi:hypothetical protein OP500_10955, partial [Kingella sp. SNUBH-2017]|uniref:hypothetical protein n=1 Tax=Kingella sp. SNUBH-2017 TaxID=2994077 RepID=UPI0023632160